MDPRVSVAPPGDFESSRKMTVLSKLFKTIIFFSFPFFFFFFFAFSFNSSPTNKWRLCNHFRFGQVFSVTRL